MQERNSKVLATEWKENLLCRGAFTLLFEYVILLFYLFLFFFI